MGVDRKMVEYGSFVVVDHDGIEEAKKVMIEEIHNMIDEMAAKDDFWIVRNTNEFDEMFGVPRGKVTVGWKIGAPSFQP